MHAKHAPFPQLVRPDKHWTIEEHIGQNGSVSLSTAKDATMTVPLDDSHISGMIRNHELAHARFTPANAARKLQKLGIDALSANAAENYRIEQNARKFGVKTCLCDAGCAECDTVMDSHQAELTQHFAGSGREAMAEYLAGIFAGLQHCRMEAVDYDVRDHVEQLQRRYGIGPKLLQPLAEYLHGLLTQAADGQGEVIPGKGTQGVKARGGWARTQLLEPARHRAHRRPIRRFATDNGVSVADVGRILSDGRVFQDRKRAAAVSILIDASGSMSLAQEDIEALLTRWPASIVAMYAGRHGSAIDAKGSIVVLAKNGRMLTADAIATVRGTIGGGNCCDGPALRWLLDQASDRIWICDGVVTNHQDNQTEACSVECRELVTAGRVKQYESVSDLLDSDPRKPPPPSTCVVK